jgi:hypothetical protein
MPRGGHSGRVSAKQTGQGRTREQSGFDPEYEGMDWRSLRLVFEKKNDIWYLVGIIHDQWTI